MKEKIKEKQKPSLGAEEEISERICKKLEEEKVPVSELDNFILKELEDDVSFSEDWQKHYAKERIKDRVKEKKYNFIPATRIKRFLNLILDWGGIYLFATIFGLILWVIDLHFIIENISKIEAGQRRIDVVQLKEFAKIYQKPINYFLK